MIQRPQCLSLSIVRNVAINSAFYIQAQLSKIDCDNVVKVNQSQKNFSVLKRITLSRILKCEVCDFPSLLSKRIQISDPYLFSKVLIMSQGWCRHLQSQHLGS